MKKLPNTVRRPLTKAYLTDLTYKINGAAIEVHKILGPGLLEKTYHACMIYELAARKIPFQSEFEIPFTYKGESIPLNFRCDFYIEDLLVVEFKAAEATLPIHEAQLITYMKLLKAPKGILINFNVTNLYYSGHKTYVNHYFDQLPNK